ncbi:ABC transporter ATP-binding protein [Isoalcanivorax beigongshangi]|uniref:ABC-type dipeptide transporter n=1 Tax=Isoalcanivorax beigongshangi TaxID=3238810 RepID=A0ABV4AHB6_9GAMM
MSLLSVTDLSVRFGDHTVVDQLSLSLQRGRMLALVGESGSGKSLTALALMRLLPHSAMMSASAITLAGEDLLHCNDAQMRSLRGRRIGMIFQEPLSALNPLHRVSRQIGECLQVHQRLSASAVRQRTLELLAQVQLPDPERFLERFPHQLSGGQRQRVMIAMALANGPELLIADEPTTALDVTVQAGILSLLKQLQNELGLAVLLITHDLGVVAGHADDVAVMHQGRVVEHGPAQQVLTAPQAEYTRHLLASEPDGQASPAALPDAAPLLAAERLSVRFKQPTPLFRPRRWLHAVDKVSLQVAPGQTLGIVGESGSGKSTLALALLRLIRSDGSIRLGDQQLDTLRGTRALRPVRARLQVVFQDPWSTLNPRLTVGQIITEGLRVHLPQLSAAEQDQRLQEMLSEVGLEADAAHRYPHEFSGGQRQRIAIARALILHPQVLILDEPTSALDRSVQHQVLTLLKRLQQRHGLTYLFISHDLKVVRSISHQVLVMKDGKVVESGATETLFQQPQNPYTQQLLAAAFAR